jgi:hypothetical protein
VVWCGGRAVAGLGEVQLARLSALKQQGGTVRIWPHCGPTNARLRLHLPIAVPAGEFTLSVGGERRRWREGVPLLFDDSFRHEVFAKPSLAAHDNVPTEPVGDDGGVGYVGDVRLVLIVDVWHPSVPADERAALSLVPASAPTLLHGTPVPRYCTLRCGFVGKSGHLTGSACMALAVEGLVGAGGGAAAEAAIDRRNRFLAAGCVCVHGCVSLNAPMCVTSNV